MDTKTRPFARSAPLIGVGLALIGVGYVVNQLGLLARLGYGRSTESGLVRGLMENDLIVQYAQVLGALAGLVGFVALVIGVYRLASNLDALAQGRGDAAVQTSEVDVTPV
ncbi:MAG: hypothetical protein ACOH17_07325 [Cellulomonas sp.]